MRSQSLLHILLFCCFVKPTFKSVPWHYTPLQAVLSWKLPNDILFTQVVIRITRGWNSSVQCSAKSIREWHLHKSAKCFEQFVEQCKIWSGAAGFLQVDSLWVSLQIRIAESVWSPGLRVIYTRRITILMLIRSKGRYTFYRNTYARPLGNGMVLFFIQHLSSSAYWCYCRCYSLCCCHWRDS